MLQRFRRMFYEGVSSGSTSPLGSSSGPGSDSIAGTMTFDGPPSYEDSEQTSLQSVINKATERAGTTLSYLLSDTDEPKGSQENQASPTRGQEELAATLTLLAQISCGGRPFLQRIRQYRNSPSITQNSRDRLQARLYRKNEERVDEEEEETALVLLVAAHLLTKYYAKMGHRESDGFKKARLQELRSCSSPKCGCFDFDLNDTPGADNSEPSCYCSHPATTHTRSPRPLESLFRRYTNWDHDSYARLNHTSERDGRKHALRFISRCSVAACGCPDFDADRWTTTGGSSRSASSSKLCVCGHGSGLHFSRQAILEEGRKRKDYLRGRGKDPGDGSAGEISRWSRRSLDKKEESLLEGERDEWLAEWELSWIMVENCYAYFDK